MDLSQFAQAVQRNVGCVIVGKENVTELLLAALLTEGHVLLEDVPGIGKTTLAKALARSLDCSFARIQFTPDLLPSDVTGINYYNQKRQEFEFRPGPVLSQILLADEINRATPRTQSALLEAMGEGQVTADGVTYPLPEPFMALGTQNPIEFEGTFPLPEAQMDRFLMRLSLGYPGLDEENLMMQMQQLAHPIESLSQVVEKERIPELQRLVRRVQVVDSVRRYILELVRATRDNPALALGASPRGSLALFRSAQALAVMRGRDFVIPDDVKHVAVPCLAHRLVLNPENTLGGETSAGVIEELLRQIEVPLASA
jgi:MoxR-like ATPase